MAKANSSVKQRPLSPFLVYLIKCLVDGREYIGVTNLPLKEVWRRHVAGRKRGGRGSLGEAIRAAGATRNAFSMRELKRFRADQAAEAGMAEKHFIAQRRTLYPHGFNRNRGGRVGVAGAGTRFICDRYEIYGIRALAQFVNRSYGTVRSRLWSGWSLRQIVEQEPPPRRQPLRLRKRKCYQLVDGRLRSARIFQERRMRLVRE
jgi:hypothetical protein